MEKWLDELIPLMGIEHDCLLSKAGDITVAFSLELPELFTLSDKDYEAFHQAWIKSIKVLPKHSIFHKQDWFTDAQYRADFLMEDDSFLSIAQNSIKRQRDGYNAIGWRSGTWILSSNVGGQSFALWTFAGDRINRTLMRLFESEFECKIEGDYKQISIHVKKERIISLLDIQSWLMETATLEGSDLEAILLKRIKAIWFSKFSACLPESLAKKVLEERSLDISGVIRELRKVNIVITDYEG